MLKQLTLVAFTAALLPACIITTGGTDSNSNSNSDDSTATGNTDGTATGTTSDDDGTGTTQGIQTTNTPTEAETDTPTTQSPTEAATEATDTTNATSGTTTEDTTGTPSEFGQCGWHQGDISYYACSPDGVAGLEDPEGIDPIACPEGLVEGDKCDEEMGPIKSVGCCTPEGTLYYCDSENSNSILKQECGV